LRSGGKSWLRKKNLVGGFGGKKGVILKIPKSGEEQGKTHNHSAEEKKKPKVGDASQKVICS